MVFDMFRKNLKNKAMKTNKLLFFFVVIFCMSQAYSSFAQEIKIIKGKVTHKNFPLLNAHVVNENSKISVKTNDKGSYEIKAKEGDQISFSYVGLKTVKILVEDVTSTLNIKMYEEVNELETVVVKANKKPSKSQKIVAKKTQKIQTGVGEIDLRALGSNVYYVSGEDLNQATFYPAEAIANKFGNLQANREGELFDVKNYSKPQKVIWDIDGAITDNAPNWLNVTDIKDVYVLFNAGAKYGAYAVAVVITENNPLVYQEKKQQANEKYRNQNFYDETSLNTEVDFSQSDIPVNLGEKKQIYGTITHMESPVPDVMVSIAGKKGSKVFSNAKGTYRLDAQVGDIVQFSHVSFETVSIFIEDITEELNVTLQQKITELDQVLVKSNNKPKVLVEKRRKTEEEFQTSRGKINPKKSGFSQTYLDGSGMSNIYRNIQEALIGRIPGYSYEQVSGKAYLRGKNMSLNQDYPVAWEVDGVFTTEAPFVDLDQIVSVRALRAMGSSNKYGAQAPGGVIVISTRNGNFKSNSTPRKSFREEYANSNFYDGDAGITSLEIKDRNKFVNALDLYTDATKAFEFYNSSLKNKMTNYGDHIGVAIQFVERFNNKDLATKILDEQALKHSTNPEVLKSIAYYYQWLEKKRSAISTYERIFELRPKHAQSFRDLANAYANYDLYGKAWKLYYGYYIKGKVANEEGIGELIYNEMEWLHYRRANQTKIKQKFTPFHKNLTEFQKDIRMVFEWNTSEAEFELEFVSPDKRAYTFDHSLSENNSLIIEEKQIGYSSKMFFIDDLGQGKWMVNLTYKGNKKTVPTFMKVTTYYDWGKPSERKDISVYKLEIQNQKASLLKFKDEFEADQIVKN